MYYPPPSPRCLSFFSVFLPFGSDLFLCSHHLKIIPFVHHSPLALIIHPLYLSRRLGTDQASIPAVLETVHCRSLVFFFSFAFLLDSATHTPPLICKVVIFFKNQSVYLCTSAVSIQKLVFVFWDPQSFFAGHLFLSYLQKCSGCFFFLGSLWLNRCMIGHAVG